MTARFDPSSLLDRMVVVNSAANEKVNILGAVAEPPIMTRTIDGASTLEVTAADYERRLIRSDGIDERSWMIVDDLHFELVALSKTGDLLKLTFEDSIVAALRRRTKKMSFPASSTTRRQIGIKFAREAGVKYSIDPQQRRQIAKPIVRSAGGKKTNSWEVLGAEIAEPIRWRRFSDGKRLILGSDDWLKTRYKAIELRENTASVGSIDFDLDVAKRASTAKLTIDTKLMRLDPGMPVRIPKLGPASGIWLVSEIAQPLSSPRADVTLTRAKHVLAEPKKKKGAARREHGDRDNVPGNRGKDDNRRAGNGARQKMVNYALAQRGKAYVWGASGPNGFDCSGLVQQATRAGGRALGKPAASQWAACVRAHKTIPVRTALNTRGALLFRIGVGDYNHVAISLGNGNTIEARGTGYGVGIFGGAASRGWTGAAIWL